MHLIDFVYAQFESMTFIKKWRCVDVEDPGYGELMFTFEGIQDTHQREQVSVPHAEVFRNCKRFIQEALNGTK